MGSIKLQSVSKKRRIEATCLHGCSWLRSRAEPAVGVLQLLIVVIEEHFVLHDRPAQRPAEVVVALLRFGASIEVVARIECVVLDIVICGAVKSTAPALEDDVEDRTTAAVLGRGVCRNDI